LVYAADSQNYSKTIHINKPTAAARWDENDKGPFAGPVKGTGSEDVVVKDETIWVVP
jgi:hypothetical protein